jgi:NADPH:quinone reductase-like Zn-dependent oxidoreductase
MFDQYGKAEDVLSLRDVPEPSPGPGEVKVKMLYSPINPSDLTNTIEGAYRKAVGKTIWNHGKAESELTVDPDGARPLPSPPLVPGLEGVGEVVEAGAGLYPRMLVGKRVAVVGSKLGNWQEYTITDAKQALPVRKGVSDEQAAVSFVNPVTAYVMVKEVLGCGPGDLVLQSAGNSELGKMVARLGKHFGFQTASIVRDGAQAAKLREGGADHVIDISSEDLRDRVCVITGGKGVQHALDPVGGELASDLMQCLGLGGTLVVYGTLTTEPLNFSSRDLMTPLSSVRGFFLGNWMASRTLLQKLAVTRKVGKLLEAGVLQSEIREVFPLEEYTRALATVREPGNRGKVLLRL